MKLSYRHAELCWASLAHWLENYQIAATTLNLPRSAITGGACPLCQTFDKLFCLSMENEICPIYLHTSFPGCTYTPWSHVHSEREIPHNPRLPDAVLAEYQFLVELCCSIELDAQQVICGTKTTTFVAQKTH